MLIVKCLRSLHASPLITLIKNTKCFFLRFYFGLPWEYWKFSNLHCFSFFAHWRSCSIWNEPLESHTTKINFQRFDKKFLQTLTNPFHFEFFLFSSVSGTRKWLGRDISQFSSGELVRRSGRKGSQWPKIESILKLLSECFNATNTHKASSEPLWCQISVCTFFSDISQSWFVYNMASYFSFRFFSIWEVHLLF